MSLCANIGLPEVLAGHIETTLAALNVPA